MVGDYLTFEEAAQLLDRNPAATKTFLSRHHVPRYVRRDDVLLAMAASGRGSRQDQCIDGGEHNWSSEREVDISGDPLVWCAKIGCDVGVVLHEDETVTYRRRPSEEERVGRTIGRSGWTRDPDGAYRMNTQVQMRLTHQQLAWAIFYAYNGQTLHEVDDDGNLTFRRGQDVHDPIPRRDVREQVLDWLGRRGTEALSGRTLESSMPPEIYLWAASVIYKVPDVAHAERQRNDQV